VQHHAADQLHVEVAHAQHPLAGFAHHRKGFRQQLIKQLALPGRGFRLRQHLLEAGSLATQLVVAVWGDLLLQQVDVRHQGLKALQLAGIGITQQEFEHCSGHLIGFSLSPLNL